MAAPDDGAAGVNRRGQLLGVAFVLVALVVAALLGTGAFAGSDPAEDASVVDGVKGTEETTALLRGVPQDGIVLGRPDAPVTVVEFVDVKCPVCQSFALGNAKKLVQDLVRPGRAKIELRVIGVIGMDEKNPDTLVGRTAVNALAAKDRAWALAELLFYNQGNEAERWVTPERLAKIGATAPELRGTPITTTPTRETIRLGAESDALSKRLDVGGTPTIFVRPSDRTDDAAFRKVDLRGTGSDAGKIASAVDDLR
jgi:protein-disulfide isomerase